jgi:hypothetical protein
VSLQTCCWWAEKLPDNVTCGEGCQQFPACLPTLELIRKLTERAKLPNLHRQLLADPLPPVAAMAATSGPVPNAR